MHTVWTRDLLLNINTLLQHESELKRKLFTDKNSFIYFQRMKKWIVESRAKKRQQKMSLYAILKISMSLDKFYESYGITIGICKH